MALAQGAADAFFTRSGCASRGVRVSVQGAVPVSCGLGSSVTVRLGIVYGLNEIHDRPLTKPDMLELVTGLEGHPDNCAPALFGGFVVSGQLDHTVRHCRFPVPARLKFVGCVPDFAVSTAKARTLLPTQVTLAEAVENLNRVALITAAFASEDYSTLRGLFVDHLHQPYRKQLLPQLDDVIASGVEAGADGGWLSGSGSTIMCLTTKHESAVATAMAAVFQRVGIQAQTLVLTADNDGTKVVE